MVGWGKKEVEGEGGREQLYSLWKLTNDFRETCSPQSLLACNLWLGLLRYGRPGRTS